MDWLRPIAKDLKKVFLVHGETGQATALAQLITREYGVKAVQPARGDSFELK